MRREAYFIMMAADVLALNRRQAISNNHVVSSMTTDYDNWHNSYYAAYISCYSHYTNNAWKRPGPWFNIKMSSYQYRKPHCGDKTILRPSYLHNRISYTGKMTSLYWIGAQEVSNPLALGPSLLVGLSSQIDNALYQIIVGCHYNVVQYNMIFHTALHRP